MKASKQSIKRIELLCIVLLLITLLSAGMAYASSHPAPRNNVAFTATPSAAGLSTSVSPNTTYTNDIRLTDGIITWAVIIVLIILGGTLFTIRRKRY